ncbi:hypothetical protein Ahy_B07g086458 isoform A [Arachis hypogaea]|uniref:Carbamoyl-phosphate synthase (glutamine-hydrolyzing) n=1 Tax=Arachis hypogaea TaxID=3818 RepID=A0A444Y9R9_ARAHY|nr:hypothetical protein Ahy_B07g086458 isoform A [Arachis hypogaea]
MCLLICLNLQSAMLSGKAWDNLLKNMVLEAKHPDSLLPTMGSQTTLNLVVKLSESGALEKNGVELIRRSWRLLRRPGLLLRSVERVVGLLTIGKSLRRFARILIPWEFIPVTVAPAQTLTDKEYQRNRDYSIAIIREIGVECGGSNVQFAINPINGEVMVIEMNPRVSRSSALASKATGFLIAKMATKLSLKELVDVENFLMSHNLSDLTNVDFYDVKKRGFSDKQIAFATKSAEMEVRCRRLSLGVTPAYKRVDTCAAEFEANTLYMYSSYDFGCRAMEIVYSNDKLVTYLETAVEVDPEPPVVVIDKYLSNAIEIDVGALTDSHGNMVIGGIMEHIEQAGPEMRSTGEVMGIDSLYNTAFAQAQIASSQKLPTSGIVFLSLNDLTKPHLEKIAKTFVEVGFKTVATSGTALALKSANIPAERVLKMHEGEAKYTWHSYMPLFELSHFLLTGSGNLKLSHSFISSLALKIPEWLSSSLPVYLVASSLQIFSRSSSPAVEAAGPEAGRRCHLLTLSLAISFFPTVSFLCASRSWSPIW